ncbi:interferon alpha-5 isoform X2 [Misgurnus anguillicaudatus]|uniref:interferon alpha-5 isoform X2 n=1 Tax=Misgurnus anguillicaudatus TaxID=75329 RepID=UPI0024358746|nr:interferon kappa-like isoform X2 [Misgurnus anguillicaudatus]
MECKFASMSDQQLLKTTIGLLHKLGHRKPYMKCYREVGITSFDLSSSLPEKAQEMQPALKIAFNHTFEIFKKKSHGHWNSTALNDLMTFLHMQNKTYENSKVSSELETLETLVKNFKKLDQFLTEQNFSKCAWEIVRNEILGVMDTFRKKL